MEIKQICYVSFLSEGLNVEEVVQSLKKVCEEKNPKYNITGKLLYSNSIFMQLLEGPEINVDLTYRIIQSDERHYNPHVLFEKEAGQRAFPDWGMKFSPSDKLDISLINKILRYNVKFKEDELYNTKVIQGLFKEFEKEMNKKN